MACTRQCLCMVKKKLNDIHKVNFSQFTFVSECRWIERGKSKGWRAKFGTPFICHLYSTFSSIFSRSLPGFLPHVLSNLILRLLFVTTAIIYVIFIKLAYTEPKWKERRSAARKYAGFVNICHLHSLACKVCLQTKFTTSSLLFHFCAVIELYLVKLSPHLTSTPNIIKN